jgi:hypothetical protein
MNVEVHKDYAYNYNVNLCKIQKNGLSAILKSLKFFTSMKFLQYFKFILLL